MYDVKTFLQKIEQYIIIIYSIKNCKTFLQKIEQYIIKK